MPQHTLAVIEPQANTALVWRLLSRGVEVTTQVQVVVDATDTAADLRMTISTDEAGAEVVAISSDPIVIAADGDAMRRSAQFELTAKTTGRATVRIFVTDDINNVTVALRVIVVAAAQIAVIEPQANTEWRLLNRGVEAKTTGRATVRIFVTDGASTATVVLRVVVTELPPLQILIPSDGTQIALVRGDGSLAATQWKLFSCSSTRKFLSHWTCD